MIEGELAKHLRRVALILLGYMVRCSLNRPIRDAL